jgi:hypothetical protein
MKLYTDVCGTKVLQRNFRVPAERVCLGVELTKLMESPALCSCWYVHRHGDTRTLFKLRILTEFGDQGCLKFFDELCIPFLMHCTLQAIYISQDSDGLASPRLG